MMIGQTINFTNIILEFLDNGDDATVPDSQAKGNFKKKCHHP